MPVSIHFTPITFPFSYIKSDTANPVYISTPFPMATSAKYLHALDNEIILFPALFIYGG